MSELNPFEIAQQQLDEAEQQGLISWNHHRIMPTVVGRRYLNDLLQIFLPEKREEHINI